MDCTITTPESLVFEGSVKSVVVPAVDGELGFLPKHAPLVSTLGHGEVRVSEDSGDQHRFFVDGGFVQVLGDRVTVLAVDAVPVASLDAAAEKENVAKISASKPAAGASLDERAGYGRALAAAKTRLRLASR
jgi:F-type H+-transporting ATPase subunit epsilon